MTPREQPASAFATITTSHKLYVGLCAIFVSSLLLGDIIGGKTLTTPLGPISVGMLPFPVTFLLTDIVNDFYGRKGAHFLTAVGFWMALFAWIILQLGTALPIDGSTYITQPEFAKIFGGSSQLFVASMVAYLLGQLLDIHVFQFWKTLTASKHLWLRATGSTILSQAIDTTTVNAVFWKWTAGREWGWIFAKVAREYSIKLVIALALTPIVYALHAAIVRGLKIEPEHHAAG
jgi:uncharacterized integral membrane protein (TIGR00697 family)